MRLPSSMTSAEASIMHVTCTPLRSAATNERHLDFEAWKDLIRTMGGRFNPEGIEPNAFTGSVCPLSITGFPPADVGSHPHRVERTHREVRPDGADHYFTMFQVAGQPSTTIHQE